MPLVDMGEGRLHHGFEGGLYPGGANEMPDDHSAAGFARAAAIQPLDTAGQPAPTGAHVLLSIGMSNTAQEFRRLIGLARHDPMVNHDTLAIVNGAIRGAAASVWVSPSMRTYDDVDGWLAGQGFSNAQVQIIWLKLANAWPRVSLPNAGADAFALRDSLAKVARALLVRFPNLLQVFVSSRIYHAVGPQPGALRLRIRVLGQMADRGADQAATRQGRRPGNGRLACGCRALARLGALPVGRRRHPARRWTDLAAGRLLVGLYPPWHARAREGGRGVDRVLQDVRAHAAVVRR